MRGTTQPSAPLIYVRLCGQHWMDWCACRHSTDACMSWNVVDMQVVWTVAYFVYLNGEIGTWLLAFLVCSAFLAPDGQR